MIHISSKTWVSSNLKKYGPIIEVVFSVPATMEKVLAESGNKVPAPLNVPALIDTGASDSFIDSEIASKLGLTPINVRPIQLDTGSSKPETTSTFFARIKFEDLYKTYEMEFAELEELNKRFPYKAIIGRDILSKGFLIYNQKQNEFTFGLRN